MTDTEFLQLLEDMASDELIRTAYERRTSHIFL